MRRTQLTRSKTWKLPNRASIYLAERLVVALAEYMPKANKDKPPTATIVLSQSFRRDCAPAPITDPAVLKHIIIITTKK